MPVWSWARRAIPQFIRPVECPPGSDITADFGDFGSVAISFA